MKIKTLMIGPNGVWADAPNTLGFSVALPPRLASEVK